MKQKRKFFAKGAALVAVTLSFGLSLCLLNRNNQNVKIAEAAAPSSYYSSINDSMTGTTLLNALRSIIDTSSVSVSYDWSRYEAADQDPSNSSNIITIYARTSLKKTAHVSGGTGWNREHTFPASKLSNAKAEKDNHIIFASDNKVNSARSNIKMGVVTTGSTITDSYGNSTTCKKTGSLFDPNNRARGIVARSTMYAAAMYGYDPMDNFESYETLLTWHLTYAVDSFDQKRNDVVYGNQKNRNPFVDHPEYACKIWGDKSEKTKSICSGQIVPSGDTSENSGDNNNNNNQSEFHLEPWQLALIIGGSVLVVAAVVTVVVIVVVRKKKRAAKAE